ncbi:unnamed protein product [Colias eurytheme]|nr:unnamed protein product [Colias eurytheme]
MWRRRRGRAGEQHVHRVSRPGPRQARAPPASDVDAWSRPPRQRSPSASPARAAPLLSPPLPGVAFAQVAPRPLSYFSARPPVQPVLLVALPTASPDPRSTHILNKKKKNKVERPARAHSARRAARYAVRSLLSALPLPRAAAVSLPTPEPPEWRELQKPQEPKAREPQEPRGPWELREPRELWEPRELQEPHEPKEPFQVAPEVEQHSSFRNIAVQAHGQLLQ